MSLRLQLTLLFGAILVVTMTVAAMLGSATAQRAVEEVVQERTVEVARSVVADLDLAHGAARTLDHDAIADRLAVAMPLHRGLKSAELVLLRNGKLEVSGIEFGSGGLQVTLDTRAGPLPEPKPVRIEEDEGGRVATAEVAVRDAARKPIGLLHVEADVSYANEIADRERGVFFSVTAASAIVLALFFVFVLGPMLARPLSQLADVMGRVQSGGPGGPPVPGADRTDEIGIVARGLDAMLARIRGAAGSHREGAARRAGPALRHDRARAREPAQRDERPGPAPRPRPRLSADDPERAGRARR